MIDPTGARRGAAAGRPSALPLPHDGPPTASARLLVADDDAGVRALLGAVLAGSAVLEAARGDEALALARRERPDLVLLDVRLPGLDGLAVARALAADPATAAVPVVVCSGAGPEAAAAAGRLASVVAFVPKPFAPRALRAAVASALAGGAGAGAPAGGA
jgi:CheY-like chemotaxis protein